MRRLLTFPCDGIALGGTLDEAAGRTGVLLVTGGTQTRVGPHRMFERLAARLAQNGYPCFRFDRRGVGDSAGEDPGFRDSTGDLAAAADRFRSEMPGMEHMVGFGLCDGGTALALFGRTAGLDAVILANPWLVEAKAGDPPAAAVRRRYAERLTSLEGWKRLLTGGISYRKLAKGVATLGAPQDDGLAEAVAASLRKAAMPVSLILAKGDATAIAAASIWNSTPYRDLRDFNEAPFLIESQSHSFAARGDEAALLEATLGALQQLHRRMAR